MQGLEICFYKMSTTFAQSDSAISSYHIWKIQDTVDWTMLMHVCLKNHLITIASYSLYQLYNTTLNSLHA